MRDSNPGRSGGSDLDVRCQLFCCDCYKAHRPSSAVGKGWKRFQLRGSKGPVVDVVQCQVVSVEEIVEEGLKDCRVLFWIRSFRWSPGVGIEYCS